MSKTLTLALLLASSGAFAADPAAHLGKADQPAADSKAAAQSGLRVYRDPATGEFLDRAPATASKRRALVQPPNYDTLDVVQLPNGAHVARARNRQFHSAATVRVAADGTFEPGCTQGADDPHPEHRH